MRGQGQSRGSGMGVKQFADVKYFSTQVCCHVCPSSPPTIPPKKTLDLRNFGWGRVGTCPPVATLLLVDRVELWNASRLNKQKT